MILYLFCSFINDSHTYSCLNIRKCLREKNVPEEFPHFLQRFLCKTENHHLILPAIAFSASSSFFVFYKLGTVFSSSLSLSLRSPSLHRNNCPQAPFLLNCSVTPRGNLLILTFQSQKHPHPTSSLPVFNQNNDTFSFFCTK